MKCLEHQAHIVVGKAVEKRDSGIEPGYEISLLIITGDCADWHTDRAGPSRIAGIDGSESTSDLLHAAAYRIWGSSTAIGYGLNSIFKPGGGYYSRPVIVELRAQGLGHCGSRPAYTQLAIRGPSKPEGQLGSWHLWSEAKSLCRFGF